MKKFALLIALIAFAGFGLAQNPEKTGPLPFAKMNSIQVDFLGHGGFYSVNYERVQHNGKRFKTVLRGGVGIYPAYPGETGIRFKVPITLNEVVTIAGGHHAEVGAGILLTNDYNFFGSMFGMRFSGVEEYAAFHVGYRFQHPNCPILFKTAFTPMLGTFHKEIKPEFLPAFVVTAGYAF